MGGGGCFAAAAALTSARFETRSSRVSIEVRIILAGGSERTENARRWNGGLTPPGPTSVGRFSRHSCLTSGTETEQASLGRGCAGAAGGGLKGRSEVQLAPSEHKAAAATRERLWAACG